MRWHQAKNRERVTVAHRFYAAAGTLVCAMAVFFAMLGCNMRSKEQQREIDAIKARVMHDPSSADIDDGSGTPLDYAVLNNYMELAEWLLEHGANVNARNRREETALHWAVISDRSPDQKMIRFLLKKGADINATREYQETPLHSAAYLGLGSVAKTLIERGANVNARSGRGETPLHLASCPTGYPEIVELLLAAKADIEAKQNNGATALHQAVLAGAEPVVVVLLAKGADPNSKNQAGWTPLHYAAAGGRSVIAERLLSGRADANAIDSAGHTPLWIALNAPAVTVTAQGSKPVDTAAVAEMLRQHGATD